MQIPGPALLVYGILAVTVLLFVSERLRLDVVALLSLLALTVTGILTPAEALAGFADPVVIMIAALFVVGDGLLQTGVAEAMGRIPARLAGDSPLRLTVVLMILVATLSGFMSSTGTVALMVPVAMGLAWARDISPSKLLIPLSVASLLGGMLTLIGTPPNLVVSNHMEAVGREPFGLFAFTPVGLVMVVAGIAFMALVGQRLLPARPAPGTPLRPQDVPSLEEMAGNWELGSHRFRLRPTPGSPLLGRTLAELDLPGTLGLTVLEIRDGDASGELHLPELLALGRMGENEKGTAALADSTVGEGRTLLVAGSADGVARLVGRGHALLVSDHGEEETTSGGTGIAAVLLTPRSRLLGRTLKEVKFRDRYHLSVVGIKRLGEAVAGDLGKVALRFGDMLLVQGPWERIRLLQGEARDFVVAMTPREMGPALRPLSRAPLAVGIIVGMMLLMTLGILPAVTAVLLAAMAMVLSGCVAGEDAYLSVNWESVVLIAGILPMATALEKTGGMQLIVDALSGALAGSGPVVLLVVLFLLTSALSQVISNTATAVLLAPIAYQLSTGIGAEPEPFMMTIAVAASTAFATPMASPVNTLVLGPGGYRFGDFFRVDMRGSAARPGSSRQARESLQKSLRPKRRNPSRRGAATQSASAPAASAVPRAVPKNASKVAPV